MDNPAAAEQCRVRIMVDDIIHLHWYSLAAAAAVPCNGSRSALLLASPMNRD